MEGVYMNSTEDARKIKQNLINTGPKHNRKTSATIQGRANIL
jgi:hypothetical protein